MANQRRRDRARRTGRSETTALQYSLPYDRRNAIVFAAAIGAILVGYIAMAQPPVDGFLSLTLAPILLVIGYVFLIPAALLMKSQVELDKAAGRSETAETVAQ
jgi:hypothetical protein